MDTKIMQQFKMIPNATLAHIEGGTGWGDVFLGLLGGWSIKISYFRRIKWWPN